MKPSGKKRTIYQQSLKLLNIGDSILHCQHIGLGRGGVTHYQYINGDLSIHYSASIDLLNSVMANIKT